MNSGIQDGEISPNQPSPHKSSFLQQEEEASHCERVAGYAIAIAEELGLQHDERQHIHCAAILHDLGKIRISQRTLKTLGKLNDEELAIMRRHSILAFRILEDVDEFKAALPAIKHHDERFDGLGPEGLVGQAIPLSARILSVAEAYDILTSDVPWRDAMNHNEAMEEMQNCSGTRFDPDILEAFKRGIERRFRQAA